ncbi:uncharacterized protein LOC134187462 [Corticium candelabrum]|uniref:uncharacterized protein LOC134187462 n=1 Tax=Corticium candelabrum TaxID=121492 RepID=UPI002E264F88|nr:uncharacterized protein LOC134187462 [Corticium candelabrum]
MADTEGTRGQTARVLVSRDVRPRLAPLHGTHSSVYTTMAFRSFLVAITTFYWVHGDDQILNIDLLRPVMDVSPMLWGIFFEEINHAGDGGIYAEMVQNRAFEASVSINNIPSNISQYHSLLPVLSMASNPVFVRHCDYQGYATPINNDLDCSDSSFGLVKGLDGQEETISFLSLNYPGYYLSPKDMRIMLAKDDGTKAFSDSASFYQRPGLYNMTMASFESASLSGYYLAMNGSCTGQCGQDHGWSTCYDAIIKEKPSAPHATFIVQQANAVLKASGWSTVGSAKLTVQNTNPLNQANPNYAVISVTQSSSGVVNFGYWGMNVSKGRKYNLRFFARTADSSPSPTFTAMLQSFDGSITYASYSDFGAIGGSWRNYSCQLTSNATDSNARLSIILHSAGSIAVDVVSLMPDDLPNGYPFRQDLVDALKAMRPSFVRFPGGTYIDGITLDKAFLWKKTIGPYWERPGHDNAVWGYWSDDGLGYFEYLVMCEMLNAQPIWVINNGISVQEDVPTSKIEPWVQDALDSIEFANGPSSSHWGSMRASMGHEQSFNLSYMAIGNENCGHANYVGNYVAFYKAIKTKYPKMNLIANCDLTHHNPSAPTDLWDYHIYTSPEDFITKVHMWDSYDRSSSKVFNSEYATTRDAGKGNVLAAVAEAAWMTGMERNSDVVVLASYAPLFVNNNDRRWNPDAIVFNSSVWYGTPSYWNQVMFSVNRGVKLLNSSVSSSNASIAASVTCSDASCLKVIVKLVNYGAAQLITHVNFRNVPAGRNFSLATMETLAGGPQDENTLDDREKIVPHAKSLSDVGATMVVETVAYSVNVLTVSLK